MANSAPEYAYTVYDLDNNVEILEFSGDAGDTSPTGGTLGNIEYLDWWADNYQCTPILFKCLTPDECADYEVVELARGYHPDVLICDDEPVICDGECVVCA